MTTTSTYTCPDGSVTANRDEWTDAIIAWLEGQLAWHTALSPAGRKAIKHGIRKYLDPEQGIFAAQERWARGAKTSRVTLNQQLQKAVAEGLLVTNDNPIMRPLGSIRGGRSTNVYYPAVGVEACPGIASLEPTPTVTPLQRP
jgi:hypothetical protein